MNLRIPCPTCGWRSVEEFVYGAIPDVPDRLMSPDERDVDRVWMRSNPDGPAKEAWFHAAGCRRWTYLTRDRVSDNWI